MGGGVKRRKNSSWWKGSGLCKRARGPRKEEDADEVEEETAAALEAARLLQAAAEVTRLHTSDPLTMQPQ